MQSSPRVTAIILNWNNWPDTVACLATLEAMRYPAWHTLVVDNGSSDGSADRLASLYPSAEILRLPDNCGYAGGNNAGIRHALITGTDYIFVLNNDTAVAPDCLNRLLSAMDIHVAAIATPLLVEMDDPRKVWALGGKVNYSSGHISRLYAGCAVDDLPRQPIEVDVASGAALLCRGDVFAQVGLFDEAYFLYYEEVDWSLRARRAGFRILAVPDAVVAHKVSATLGASSPLLDYYMTRNHFRLLSRHWGGGRRALLTVRELIRQTACIIAFTTKPHAGRRIPHRNARLYALRDALIGRWGKWTSMPSPHRATCK